MSEEYNGWTNYATWRVNLEIFDGWESDFGPDMDVYDLGQSLRDTAENLICESAPEGLAQDYALAFLAEVNWREIAEHMIEDYRQEVEA